MAQGRDRDLLGLGCERLLGKGGGIGHAARSIAGRLCGSGDSRVDGLRIDVGWVSSADAGGRAGVAIFGFHPLVRGLAVGVAEGRDLYVLGVVVGCAFEHYDCRIRGHAGLIAGRRLRTTDDGPVYRLHVAAIRAGERRRAIVAFSGLRPGENGLAVGVAGGRDSDFLGVGVGLAVEGDRGRIYRLAGFGAGGGRGLAGQGRVCRPGLVIIGGKGGGGGGVSAFVGFRPGPFRFAPGYIFIWKLFKDVNRCRT